jgi:porin
MPTILLAIFLLSAALQPGGKNGIAAVARNDLIPGWAGIKAKWAERGIDPAFDYTGEVFSNVSGGIRRKSVYLDNLSLTLSLDMHKLLGWKGATLFFYGLSIQGGNPSDNVGDAQGLSNIAAFPTSRLYEAWLQQDLLNNRLSLLAGLYDLNSEFAVIESAAVFLNPSQTIDPPFAFSGRNGPSVFPYTTVGIRAKYDPGHEFYIQSAVLNGVAGNPRHPSGTQVLFDKSNGILCATEAGYVFWTSNRPKPAKPGPRRRTFRKYEKPLYNGKVALGLWFYTAKFDPILRAPNSLNPPQIGGNHGLYVLLARTVVREKSDPARDLSLYARFGFANSRINRFAAYTGGGIVFTGLIPGREQDVMGLGIVGAHNGNYYRREQLRLRRQVKLTEWNIELSYRAQVSNWLVLHPSLQYVINVNTNPAIKNALSVAFRLEISL